MSSQKEQQRQRNMAMANFQKQQYDKYHADKATIDAKIELLKTAKKDLKSALEEYETFKKNVGKLESDIDSANFKGDIRDDFKKKIKTAKDSVNSDINAHERNLSAISYEISHLETRSGNFGAMLSNLWDSITSLWQSLS